MVHLEPHSKTSHIGVLWIWFKDPTSRNEVEEPSRMTLISVLGFHKFVHSNMFFYTRTNKTNKGTWPQLPQEPLTSSMLVRLTPLPTSQAPHLRDQGFHFLWPFNVFQYTLSVGYYTDHAFLIIIGQSINIQKPEKGRVVLEKLKGTIAKVIIQTEQLATFEMSTQKIYSKK